MAFSIKEQRRRLSKYSVDLRARLALARRGIYALGFNLDRTE